MNLTLLLQLLVSLVFIFLLLSIIASGLNEIIRYVLQSRGFFLKNALKEVLDDSALNKNYTELLYDHPLVDRLKKTQNSLPSYITSDTFASTLIDVIGREYEKDHVLFKQNPVTLLMELDGTPKEADLLKRFNAGVEKMRYSDLKIYFRNLADRSKDYNELKSNLEKWFNDYMDRVTGWYKNRMQWLLFLIGLAISIGANVDTISLTKNLYHNQILTTQLSGAADQYIQNHKTISTTDSLAELVKNIDQAYNMLKLYELPVGWKSIHEYADLWKGCSAGNTVPGMIGEVIWKIISKSFGWILTAAAISFGAPFWFDLLGKLVDLRKAGKKPVVDNSSNT
jgi:hypothetical protein